MIRLLSIVIMITISSTAFSRDIYGYIKDGKGTPVPNADVRIMQKHRSIFIGQTETDSIGMFRVGNVPEDTITINVSSVGFELKEVELYNYSCPLHITLLEKVHALDEVTVTANSTVLYKNKVSFFPSKKEKKISNGGYNLLYNMPISVLSVNPLLKSITTNMGDGVEVFINGIPASSVEVQNIRTEDVKKVEYLEQPSDPRFNNARYALNIVVARYDRGGYTKIDGQQRFVTPSGNYSVYTHYELGKMAYDLLGGFEYDKQSHFGERSNTVYNFPNLTMDKSDYKMGKTKTKQGYATFRAKYVSDSMTIANSVGVQINRTPYRNLSGNTSIMLEDREVPDEFTFESHRDERYYSFEWNGDYFLRLKNNFDLTSELTASYMKTSQDYDYSALGQSILNDIEEDAWNFKVNATLCKRLRAVSFGLNLISSYNGNTIHYLGTTPSNVKVTDWYVMPRLVFNLSTGKFRVNGNVGVSYEEATYNGLREVYFFPKSFISGGWNFDTKNALSFSFEYSMFGNSLGMKSPNMIMTDNETAIKGNPELKNFHFISPSVSYKFVPNKQATINVFSRWQYFRRPSVFVWEPMAYDNDRTIVVRSYTNAGYLSNLRFGISGTLRLFDNNFFVKGTLTQNYFKQGGQTEVNSWPVSLSAQVNYYIKDFSISAFWEKSSKNVSIFETRKWPQNYFLALSYGNGNFIATFTCRNVLNNSWRTSESLYHSIPVNYNILNLGNEYHRSFVLSLSYSFSYGKKTNMKDRINKSGIPNTAIVE